MNHMLQLVILTKNNNQGLSSTIHMLNYIHDKSCCRSTLLQLNLTEGRHSLARFVFHGKRGELHQRYREGQEDPLGVLGLVLNVLVHWNTIYIDAALDKLKNDNFPVHDEDEVRQSPFAKAHFNSICLDDIHFLCLMK